MDSYQRKDRIEGMLRYTLANRPRSLGQVSLVGLRLGQTPNAIATAKVVDDAGQPVPGVFLKGTFSGRVTTDSNGLAVFETNRPASYERIALYETEQTSTIRKNYDTHTQDKEVVTTPPPGPAPIIFTITRKNALQPTPDSQGSRSSTSPGSIPWVPIGIGLAVVAALGASEIFGLTNLLGLKK